jgi:hypothetical protein
MGAVVTGAIARSPTRQFAFYQMRLATSQTVATLYQELFSLTNFSKFDSSLKPDRPLDRTLAYKTYQICHITPRSESLLLVRSLERANQAGYLWL